MTIQLIVLAVLLITFFIFIAHFEPSLGPVKMQLKNIQHQREAFNHFNSVKQLTPEISILNNQFYNKINLHRHIRNGL